MEQFFVDYLNPLSLILLLTGGIYFIAGWIQEKYPPKNINSIYGYRTKASMRNPEVWKFAQEVSSKKMKRDGLYLIVFGLLLSFLDLKGQFYLWIGIVLSVWAPLRMLISVEKQIKKHFPNKEN
ncbi:MAG: SdpI family protein [Flavobacteriaceae bacterium]